MSKSMNMLRTRRRDNNVKPNRRLDRKSSRGMIYENEELRLKTININAEIERGQSDIKKLRRENEMLKKEIWYLRDEYEKLDKLLKQKEEDFSSSSSTWSSDSEASCSEDPKEVETSQNLENVQKTNLKNLQSEFDHLSVVPEEPSPENSDKSHASACDLHADELTIDPSGSHLQLPPDQEYPFSMPKHFFAPLPKLPVSPQRPLTPPNIPHFYTFRNDTSTIMLNDSKLIGPGIPGPSIINKPVDLIVKTDNTQFNSDNLAAMPSLSKLDPMQMLEVEHLQNQQREFQQLPTTSLQGAFPLAHQFNGGSLPRSSFSNGGNLEELLNDIQTISEDILKISHPNVETQDAEHLPLCFEPPAGPFPNGELTVYHPGHYPLEKSSFNENVQSLDRLTGPSSLESEEVVEGKTKCLANLDKYKSEISVVLMPTPMPLLGLEKYKHLSADRINLPPVRNCEDIERLQLEGQSFSDQLTSDIDLADKDSNMNGVKEVPKEEVSSDGASGKKEDKQDAKLSIRRKVSIHFKGKKDKAKSKQDNSDEAKVKTKKLKPPALTISSKPSSNTTPEDLISANHTSGGRSPQLTSTPILPRAATPCLSAPTPLPSILSNTHEPISKDSSDSERPTPHHPHTAPNKSTSASPERHDSSKKHHKHKKKKKKKTSAMSAYLKSRRNTLSTDHLSRERSVSICTDRGPYLTDDCQMSSERERTNSVSSCGTNAERNRRKLSTISRIPSGSGGKIPWCACWGNGCV